MKLRKLITRLPCTIMAFLMAFSMPMSTVCVYAESDPVIIGDTSFSDITGIVSDATLESGSLDPEIVEISVDAGNSIDEDAIRNESYAGDTADSYGSHDWSAYVSDTLPSRLSSNELALYDECDQLLSTYLNNSNVDATKFTTSKYSYYTPSSIDFSKYGLNKTQAFAVVQMFLYNNPQYYFISSIFLTTSTNIWFTFYDQFADGDVRARYTDSVFATLDKWIVACSDYETTTYMKEVSTHDKICNVVDYISGTYDQSIYSVLIENKTVCAGYSEVFYMMMNAMGIDTMTVLSDCHAWNVVRLDDGRYYCVDATWNDSLGGRYLFNVSGKNLKKYDTSANEHDVSATWTSAWVPALATSDYVPTYYDTTGFEGDGSVSLSAPDNLSGTYDSAKDEVRIDWTEVAGAAAYDVSIYDHNTDKFIGSNRIKVNHIRVTDVSGRNMLIKIRAVGNNNGKDCYSNWSSITYTNGRFTAHREDSDIKLDAPGNFRVTKSDDGSFDLNWDKVANASGYSVLLYSDVSKQSKLASLNTVATGLHVTGISESTPVYAYVRAFKSVSGVTYYSDWSVLTVRSVTPSDDTKTLGVPSAAKYEKKTDTSGSVSWVPGNNAVSTNVVVKLDSASGTVAGSLNTGGSKFNLTGVNVSKIYYVGLQSVGKDGRTSEWVYLKIAGAQSSETSGKPAVDSLLSAPDRISYEKKTSTSGRITWTSVANAVKYDVEISKLDNFSSVVGKLTMAGTAVNITGMTADSGYYVRVRAVASDGKKSDWTVYKLKSGSGSGSGSGNTTQDKPATTISAPTGVTVSTVETKNRLSWNAVQNAANYTVEIYADSAYTAKVASLKLPGTSVLINGMKSGRMYYIRVNAVNKDGKTSAWTTCNYAKK